MSILLGERVLDGLVKTFNLHLGPELASLTAPTAYYKYKRVLAKDPSVYFECWIDEVRNVNVPSTYTIAGTRHRAEVYATCRITFINRKNTAPDQAHVNAQRYASAMARVFLKYPQLEDDPYIQFAQPLTYIPSSEVIEDAGLANNVNQVTATLMVTIDETYV